MSKTRVTMREIRTSTDDPYTIRVGERCDLPRDKGKRYATLPKPEHNPFGGTIMFHHTLEEARERNRWARTVRSWQD